MKAFLLKHGRRIIFWVVLVTIFLFFRTRQNIYYLDTDIKGFKEAYLNKILFWTGIVTSISVFTCALIRSKSLLTSAIAFIYAVIACCFYLFLLQNVFLGLSLFMNRQTKHDTLQRVYVAGYLAGTEQTKANFIPYDFAAKAVTRDRKLINKVYRVGLKEKDTVSVTFYRGLLKIPFQPEPLADD